MSSAYYVVDILINSYSCILLARCVFSWFAPDPENQIWCGLLYITEPLLAPLRKALPHFAMIDISPIVLLILLDILKRLLLFCLLSI